MNLILQIDETLVLYRVKSFKNLLQRHDAFSYCHLALLALEVREVLHVYVKQPRAHLMDGLNHVRARANGMPDIYAAPDARIQTLYRFQYIQRRMPQLILRAVIVDRDTDVVFLYELFNPRQSLRRGVARDNQANPCPPAVFEFAPDVGIVIFREINGSSSVKFDACRGIVCQGLLLLLGIHRKMVFDVLRIQGQHVELLQVADHLRPAEITKRVAG